MKTLTICQPYAELILLGLKTVENRVWTTPHRGWIGIHAGKSKAWLNTYPQNPRKMEFGMLVGIARLTDCIPIAKLRKDRKLFESLKPYAEGPYCWMLEDVRRFVDPVELAGKQGLFDADNRLFDAPTVAAGPRCRVCGCTNDNACDEGCSWIEYDLCSACDGGSENEDRCPLS